MPTPSVSRPPDNVSSVAACLATNTGLCSGNSSTPVAMRIVEVAAAAKLSPISGSIQSAVDGHGDLPVVRVRIPRRGPVHHHDVLTRPQGGETTPFRGGRHGVDDRTVGTGTDAQGMQSQPHRAIVSRGEQQVPPR